MESSRIECPRCGFKSEPEWAYCPSCSFALTPGDARGTLSDRIRYVPQHTRPPRKRKLIPSLAGAFALVSVVLLLGEGILLFSPSLISAILNSRAPVAVRSVDRPRAPPTPDHPPRQALDFQWVTIPRGKFHWGPTNRTHIRSTGEYQILKYEVTNGQWAGYLKAEKERLKLEGRYIESVPPDWNWNPNSNSAPEPSARKWYRPVVSVTPAQVEDFCSHYLADLPGCSGARLPTPEEWEKAARGSKDDRPYPWGKKFYRYVNGQQVLPCNVVESGLGHACDVFQYERSDVSPYGVVGMGGNVAEFVGEVDPGTQAFVTLEFMGGTYQDNRLDAQLFYESPLSPSCDFRWRYVGFRPARSIPLAEQGKRDEAGKGGRK